MDCIGVKRKLETLIEVACSNTSEHSNERNKALARIKWRLRSGLLYAGLDRAQRCVLVGPDDALVFDGRDNEHAKAKYFSAVMGRQFEVELCAS